MEEVHDRTVISDGFYHHPLGVVGVGRHDDLQARNVGEKTVQTLRVLRCVVVPAAHGCCENDRQFQFPTGHVDVFCHMIVDLIHADAEEVYEHQLNYGAHPFGGSPSGCTDEGGLRDGCIHYSLGSKLVEKSSGGAEDTAVLGHIFTHDEHFLVALHLLGDSL